MTKEALTQEQEPVFWWNGGTQFATQKSKDWDKRTGGTTAFGCDIPLYTTQPQRKPLTADEPKEPKNGEQWHVVWWNESCRMMLPSSAKLDRFVAYKNGTLQFTIKKAAHGIKENT